MTKAIEVRNQQVVATVSDELTVDQLVAQAKKIQEAMNAVMNEGDHYGVIPGTDKPTLYKAGAEKLILLFRLDPQYEVLEKTESNDRVSYLVRCTLYHSPSGTRVASGMGECNSLETKYRYRWTTSDTKPDNKATADELVAKGMGRWRKIKGKWAWQTRADNDNPMELANTILKMACKRALVAGVLNATAASDIFTQDLEDLTTPDTVQVVEADTLGELMNLLANAYDVDPKLWAADVVLKNAAQRFQREIPNMHQLTEVEAQAIIAGAKTWLEANKPEDENEAVQPDEIEIVDSLNEVLNEDVAMTPEDVAKATKMMEADEDVSQGHADA